jgi:hypothetical protein
MTKLGIDPKEEKRQQEAQEKLERERKLRINDLKKILSTPEGRRTIWNELSRAKTFADCFSTNSLEMAKFCGQRLVGLSLLADIMEARSEAFYQMYTEEMSKKKSEEKEGQTKQEEENVRD